MSQAWPPRPPRILTGTVAGVSSAGYTPVVFPAGFFTAAPRVSVVGAPSVTPVYIDPSGPTVSGFGVASGASSGHRVDWIAVQA